MDRRLAGDRALDLCPNCQMPLPEDVRDYCELRRYGTIVAHKEDECVRLLRAEIKRLRPSYERYETVRRMNVEEFGRAYKLNVLTGRPFDEIIDGLRPLFFP